MGSVGQNSTFLEYGHVAYQIKENHECSSMVANLLPAYNPLALGMGSIVSKGAKIRSRYNQVPHPPHPECQWESYELTVRHHKREPRGQPFPSR